MIERVPAGTPTVAVRGRRVVTPLRSASVTGPIWVVEIIAPEASPNAAATTPESAWSAKPPMFADSVTPTWPASISVAAAETSTVCDALETPVAFPPVKNLVPPPIFAAIVLSGNCGEP